MPIRLLDERVIGKIAAGEVIERPASVVKELVENSLDAGARRVSVAVRGGGTGSIEVVDDGCGIARDELALAITRHATSKLADWGDLDHLTSLGFRGEALPSIAAVSDFKLRSRRAEDPAGSELAVAYGVERPIRAVAAPAGTRLAVSDLFGNVPARKKFLRQASTETGVITRFVSAYALARPDVAFDLTCDDRRSFATAGQGDDVAAVAAVWGPETAAGVIPLAELDETSRVPGVRVEGWVGAPAVTRSHRNGMIFLVNGRWVQNRALGYAFEEAYHSLVMVGRHPVGVVRITLDPATVDVNVHPAKSEVKFLDERAVCRAVQRAAHAALAAARPDEVPEIRLGGGVGSSPVNLSIPIGGRENGSASGPYGRDSGFGIRPVPFEPEQRGGVPLPAPRVAGHEGGAEGVAVIPERAVPVLRVLGQVNETYIIAEGPDGMFMIDQHAAHERVMYERILDQMRQRKVDTQPLLDPYVLQLSTDEYAAFERSATELERIGFEITPFGPQTVAVRAIPALIRGVDIGERLRLILGELAEGGTGESWLDAVAISAACHTSIRAGQALSLAEMRELVADLERTSQPRACGHGRPTMLHLSQTELERQFSRR